MKRINCGCLWSRLDLLALAAAATIFCCALPPVTNAQTAPPQVVTVPTVSGPIPVSQTSRVYGAASDARLPLILPALGYVEEEYFYSSKANVYDWAKSGEVSIRTANAPYTTRMIVRRPVDPAKFSGTVWVEFMNSVARIDEAMAWGYANYYIMDHGDAYVGISAAFDGDSLATLKKFDPVRYASLSMANPAPLPGGCKEAGKDYSAETEVGLRWDMLSQAGALLKSDVPSRPLASLKVQRLFVFGQSNGDLPTYISAFGNNANLATGKPVWDGYLLKDSGIPIRTNQCDERPSATDPRRVFKGIHAPIIQIVVENSLLNGYGSRRPDSDAPGDLYRRYEIPGSSHVDPYVTYWLPKTEVLNAVGINPLWPFARTCFPLVAMNDFPIHYYVAGAMQNLDSWVRDGVSPPHADRIQLANEGTPNARPVLDQYGNAMGGVRNAYVEVPSTAYHENGSCGDVERQFSWKQLETIYGSYSNYQAKFNAAVDRDVEQRWVPKAYAARIKAGLIDMPTMEIAKKPASGRPSQ